MRWPRPRAATGRPGPARELATLSTRAATPSSPRRNFINAGAGNKLQERASAEAALGATQANLAAAWDQQPPRRRALGHPSAAPTCACARRSPASFVARDAGIHDRRAGGAAADRTVVAVGQVRLDQARSSGLAVGLPAQIVLRSRRAHADRQVARVEAVSDSVTEERIAQVAFDQAPAALSVGEPRRGEV